MKFFMPFIWPILVFLLAWFLGAGYFFSSPSDGSPSYKIVFVFLLLTVFTFGWLLAVLYKSIHGLISELSGKYSDLERLLLDVRDGTKTFFKEKRQWARVKDGISARLTRKDSDEFMKVIDISYGGALLRTKQKFELGQVFELYLYLPFFPQPIEARVEVKRLFAPEPEPSSEFNIGVEFLNMTASDKQKLIETITLLKSSPK